MTVGWVPTDSLIAAAQQATHDSVIAGLGDTRTGGVRWRVLTGAEALPVLSDIIEFDHEASELRRLIEDEGGFVVVAMAPGTPT